MKNIVLTDQEQEFDLVQAVEREKNRIKVAKFLDAKAFENEFLTALERAEFYSNIKRHVESICQRFFPEFDFDSELFQEYNKNKSLFPCEIPIMDDEFTVSKPVEYIRINEIPSSYPISRRPVAAAKHDWSLAIDLRLYVVFKPIKEPSSDFTTGLKQCKVLLINVTDMSASTKDYTYYGKEFTFFLTKKNDNI